MHPWIALATLLGWLALGLPQQADGVLEDFPAGDGPSRARISLCIGINRYARMSGRDLKGCVADARKFRELLAARYGFERNALLTDGRATRAGIGAQLAKLVAEAATARERLGRGPLVVLFYSGHGSYCGDQETPELGADEESGRDSTWVAADSALETGENDVRDDEIFAALGRLAATGAEVLFVSDSCHSGTVCRSGDAALAKTVPRDPKARGPAANLFPPPARPAGAPAASIELPSGVVAITASTDEQCARECVDSAGAHSGRLTWALHRLLATLPPSTTYDELFGRLATSFASRGFTSGPFGQSPQFHAGEAERKRPVLGGAAAPAPLDAGFAPAFADFVVHAAPSLPAEAAARLKAWADEKRFGLSAANYDVAVYPDGAGYAIHAAELLPEPDGRGGSPLRRAPDLAALSDALLELAILQKLRGLEDSAGALQVRVIPWREKMGQLAPATAELVDGLPRLRDGDHFTLAVRNLGPDPVHVAWFDVDLGTKAGFKGHLALLPPSPLDEDRIVKPGEEAEYFVDRKWQVSRASHAGRHQVKAVATTVKIDFAPMLERSGPARGADASDPVAFMKGAAAASALRDPTAPRRALAWSAGSLVLEVD